ncbi:MAG: hypothetical protein HYW27_00575 [Candidatus Aenigmarchaeota archaeon]|nr:hypothetical protein [Candidatus Aenigmarchaeota archaeon]
MFGKKKKEEKMKELPIDEIQGMSRKGMTDHEIIKTLKSKGYSYEDIEKGMLQSVKNGVEEPAPERRRFEEFSAPPAPVQQDFQMSDMPEFDVVMPDEQQQSPELMMEELIESVMEDKVSKYEAEIKGLKETIDSLQNSIKAVEQKLSEAKSQPSESVNQEFTEQFEDLQARVGGLERAFKQFLPSLTRNIESLSKMIHEMKQKHPEPAYQ